MINETFLLRDSQNQRAVTLATLHLLLGGGWGIGQQFGFNVRVRDFFQDWNV